MSKKRINYDRVVAYLDSKEGRLALGSFYNALRDENNADRKQHYKKIASTIHYIESFMKSAYKYVTLDDLYDVIEHFNISPKELH